MQEINVQRTNLVLRPDHMRVLIRPLAPITDERGANICSQVMALAEADVRVLLAQVEAGFGDRHRVFRQYLRRRFDQIRRYVHSDQELTEDRKLLLGAYFTNEYSLEAAALFNPSMVPHPDQSGLASGSLRIILSLRATGEGHISSISFRTGMVDDNGIISIQAPGRHCIEPEPQPNAFYEKHLFGRKLQELGLAGDFGLRALGELGETFTLEDLRCAIGIHEEHIPFRDKETESLAQKILALAQSNYDLEFAPNSRLSERVLFPFAPSHSNGIEDARFVLFQEEDGAKTYYATYTAYDGRMVLPQFIETPDFLHFKFITLNGPAVQNKGMALFPRKINGLYAMLARQDTRNIHLMFSNHLHFWHTTQILVRPQFPWELVQLGNCGSPIETEAGWLVLSHGVGPMRKYCISAFLLDLDNPAKIIGRMREPLIRPNEQEREGYVPNVVYSCGGLVHRGHLIIPYAMSDYATTFATAPLDEVLGAME